MRFTPTLDSLEGRQLLSLLARYPVSNNDTQYFASKSFEYLGYVASTAYDDVGDTLSAVVNWGDGTAPVMYNNVGTITRPYYTTLTTAAPGHAFQQSGTLTANITVSDQHGNSCSWNDTIYVAKSSFTVTDEEAVPVGVAYNEVGAPVRIDDTLASMDTSAVMVSTTYTFLGPDGFSSGALSAPSNGSPIADRNGFYTTPLRSDYGTVVGNHSYIEAYWDAKPGTHTVIMDMVWRNSKGVWDAEIKKDYMITAPTASVQTSFGNTTYQFLFNPLIVDNPGWFLTSFQPGQQGITIDATLSGVTAEGGTYGLVQTAKPTSYYWDLAGQKYQMYVSSDPQGRTPSDWPLLDNDPSKPDNPYYDIVAAGQYQTTWDASNALHLVDSPRVQISTLDTKIQESDSFQDFVMFTPTGGVPVPVAMNVNWNQSPQYSFTWSWGGTMTWDADGISPNPYGLQDPSLNWMAYAVPTTPTWGNTAWYYQQNMPNGIPVA